MEVDDVDMAVTAPLLQKQDLDDMKRRLKEMEEEDAALREMKEMSTTASAFSDVTKEPSVVFEKAKCYGVLGLGFREVYVGDDIPVWENMRTQGQVWSPLFSFWLSRDANEKEGGEIIFGRVNSNHFEGYHTFVPITQKGSWQLIILISYQVDRLTSNSLGQPVIHFLVRISPSQKYWTSVQGQFMMSTLEFLILLMIYKYLVSWALTRWVYQLHGVYKCRNGPNRATCRSASLSCFKPKEDSQRMVVVWN